MDQISKKKKFKRFINFHAIELFTLLPFFYHIENGVVVKALITNTSKASKAGVGNYFRPRATLLLY